MIKKMEVDIILAQLKEYVDEVLNGWGLSEGDKALTSFEQTHMPYTKYSGNQSVDHVVFRKFIRLLCHLYRIDLGELLLEVDERTKDLSQTKQDKVDATLGTEDKTIVGAINELLTVTNENKVLISEIESELDKVFYLGEKTYEELANMEYTEEGFFFAIVKSRVANITTKIPVTIRATYKNRKIIPTIFNVTRYGYRIQLDDGTYDWEWHSYATVEDVETIFAENEELRKKLTEVEQLAYAGVVL